MNYRKLIICDESTEMSVFINNNDNVVIKMQNYDNELEEFEVIEIDKDDAIELIKELTSLFNIIDKTNG